MRPDSWIATDMARYERSRRISRATADRHGIAVRYFWQPNRFTRPLVAKEPHRDGASENRGRTDEQMLRNLVPPDVVDLGDVLDDHLEPTYTDDVHHNEAGARIIAAGIYARIEGDLEALVGTRPRR